MTVPVSSLTAGELKPAAREALLVATTASLSRVSGGWYTPGRRITLRVADQLIQRGLARVEISGGRHKLVPTGSGRMLADVLRQRRASK